MDSEQARIRCDLAAVWIGVCKFVDLGFGAYSILSELIFSDVMYYGEELSRKHSMEQWSDKVMSGKVTYVAT